MQCRIDYPARVATVTMGKDEALDLAGLDVFVNHAVLDSAGLWAVDLIIDAQQAMQNSAALQHRNFRIAGTLTADTITTIRFRLNLRGSSDGRRDLAESNFAVSNTTADPNLAVIPAHPGNAKDMEVLPHMREVTDTRYSDEAVSRRVAEAIRQDIARKPPELDTDRVKTLAEASLRTVNRR